MLEFDGVLLLVSHDRYLLRGAVDRFILVRDGSAETFDGDLDDYATWLRQQEKPGSGDNADGGGNKSARKAQRQAAAAERAKNSARRKPLQKELNKVEKAMAENETRLKALSAQLADPDFYNDAEQSAQTLKEHGKLDSKQQSLEAKWLELTEQLEKIAAT